MAKKERVQKIGATHAAAMIRMGLRELRSAMFPDSNVAQQSEHGLYGTRTPGEVAQDRRDAEQDMDQEPRSIISEHVRAAERNSSDPSRSDRGVGRGRD